MRPPFLVCPRNSRRRLERAPGNRAIAVARWLALGAGLALASAAHAELQWQERRLALEPPLGAKEATAVFSFVNAGQAPVRIAEVRSTCGCTAAASQLDTIRPGQKGAVQATFHVGSRTGRQSVALTVIALEPEPKVYELNLEVAIKEFAMLMPGFVFWKIGEKPDAKSIDVKLTRGVRFQRIEAASADFETEVTETTGEVVRLRIIPRDSGVPRSGAIRIKLALENGEPVDVLAYARVL